MNGNSVNLPLNASVALLSDAYFEVQDDKQFRRRRDSGRRDHRRATILWLGTPQLAKVLGTGVMSLEASFTWVSPAEPRLVWIYTEANYTGD